MFCMNQLTLRRFLMLQYDAHIRADKDIKLTSPVSAVSRINIPG